MNSYFLVALALLTIMAIAFLMQPLWRKQQVSASDSRLPYFAVALLVPVMTVVLYVDLGTPQLAAAGAVNARMPIGMQSSAEIRRAKQGNVDSVSSLVSGLASRLEKNPEDAGGWLLLAKSYKHLDRRADAAAAYESAKALGRRDPDMDAYLDTHSSAETSFEGISGQVTMASDVAAAIDGSSTVFVIARAANGSPAPLAVLRTTVSTLPFDFNLHDGQAMIAGNELSSADAVVVTAKVSANGDALSTMPGLETHSDPVSTTKPEFVSLHLAL